MLKSGETWSSCGIHTSCITSGFAWRNDAVGCKQDYTVESFKISYLTPPCTTIVTHKVFVFFKCGIIIGREHFAVRIYIHSCSFGLFQQLFHVFQVVTADQNSRIVTHANVYFGNFGIAVRSGIGFVEQRHHLHTVFSGFKYKSSELFGVQTIVGSSHQRILHKCVHTRIFEIQIESMLAISSHTFQTINYQFAQWAYIFVFGSQHTYFGSFGFHFFGCSSRPSQNIGIWLRQSHVELCKAGFKFFTQIETFAYGRNKAFVIEIGIGNGHKQPVHDKTVGIRHFHALCSEGFGQHRKTLQLIN